MHYVVQIFGGMLGCSLCQRDRKGSCRDRIEQRETMLQPGALVQHVRIHLDVE